MDLMFKDKDKIVGFFILMISTLLLLSLVLIGRGKGLFKNYIEYHAIFEETYNLKEGAPVKLFNAEIGKVKDVKLVDDDVRVQILIVDEYSNRVRESSYVTVTSPTFIGSEYIALTSQDKSSELIPEGGQIPSIEKTSFSDLMDEFQVEKTAKKFVETVYDLSEMAKKLNSDQGPVFSILSDIETIVHDIESGKGNLGEILRTSKITDQLEARLVQIEKILGDVKIAVSKTPYTMDLVNENLERVGKIGKNIELSSENINLMVNELRVKLNEISTIISNIEKGSETVPAITATALNGLQEVREGVRKIDNTIEALQKTFIIRNKLPERQEPEQYKLDLRP
ncbi:MAG: MlaD family protein [Desulforegulaceae bacterium]|nr:MlaD family protein [Desulforegulaceae bacterium]